MSEAEKEYLQALLNWQVAVAQWMASEIAGLGGTVATADSGNNSPPPPPPPPRN